MCDTVRYECTAEPVVCGFCHCRDCQRETGSAFGATLFVPANAVTITGEVKYYDRVADSGNFVSRGFCPACGARLFEKPKALAGVIAIRGETWMTQAGFVHRETSLLGVHNRETL